MSDQLSGGGGVDPELFGAGTGANEIERILEVPLRLHVELGGKKIRVRELLEVGTGSVVELESPAGAPLAVYANDTLIAHGEAVVVGERYGVRVTTILTPAERVRRLGQGRGKL